MRTSRAWSGRAVACVAVVVTALAGGSARADDLSEDQSIVGLRSLSGDAAAIDVSVLAQEAMANAGKTSSLASLPAWSQLSNFTQLTVEVNFEYDSVAIVPESYRALGLMADALHHPVLLGFKFLIVGHTDSTGNPAYNLNLSQQRADAIREVLATTFAVPADRLFAVGVGSELPANAADPKAAINRRVQLINIGVLK
jgi:outer membrane protein OmpA-like peptidoglycan-associated protein